MVQVVNRIEEDVPTVGNGANQELSIEQAGKELFAFAVDREDVKALLAALPEEAAVDRGKVEYELGLLRIISVGWSISYFLEPFPQKNRLGEIYWAAVQEFSLNLSRTAGLMVGKDIDYFQILKDRLNRYVEAMRRERDAAEPAAVIGPEFAGVCGNVNDVYTVMTGTKMFIVTVGSVREYLQAYKLR
jgi:hypothetical protein